MNIILNILNFISNLGGTQTTAIYLMCMLIMGFWIWVYSRSIILAIITAESINLLNLTIIMTEPFLQLGTRPFMPLWISLILLALPYFYIPLRHIVLTRGNRKGA